MFASTVIFFVNYTSGCNQFCVVTWCLPATILDLAHALTYIFQPGNTEMQVFRRPVPIARCDGIHRKGSSHRNSQTNASGIRC